MKIIDIALDDFNALANEPDTLAAINPTVNRIDLTAIYCRPGVLVKGAEGVHGAALLIPFPNWSYEIHWFMPCHNGLAAISAIVDWAFESDTAHFLFGPTPRQNIAARAVNRWLGGKIIGFAVDDFGRPTVTYALSKDEWAARKKRRT